MHIYCIDLPGLKTISGELTNNNIGRTGPLVVSLALGSSHPAHLPIPNGALVMKGNAGGLYKFCLDKQTLHSVYGYVDPALNHILFRPLASEGNMTLFNGIPTTSVARGGLLAPLADDQSQDDLKEFFALASAISMPAADLGTPSVAACHAGQVIQSPVLCEKTFGSSARIQEASVPSNAMAGADLDGNPGLEALSVQEQSQVSHSLRLLGQQGLPTRFSAPPAVLAVKHLHPGWRLVWLSASRYEMQQHHSPQPQQQQTSFD
jgi:hypothetical protein